MRIIGDKNQISEDFRFLSYPFPSSQSSLNLLNFFSICTLIQHTFTITYSLLTQNVVYWCRYYYCLSTENTLECELELNEIGSILAYSTSVELYYSKFDRGNFLFLKYLFKGKPKIILMEHLTCPGDIDFSPVPGLVHYGKSDKSGIRVCHWYVPSCTYSFCSNFVHGNLHFKASIA